jgi:hypothetical protein
MGLDIAEGRETLGDLTTKQGNVLYYALEDNKRRLFRRTKVLLGDEPWPPNFHVIHELKRTDAGGLLQIEEDVEEHKAKVIFIDTLAPIRARPPKGLDPYQSDYNAIAELQKLAHRLRICIVLIYHTRKAFADDPQELIQGTTGITGAVDSWFVLNVSAEEGARLFGGGRDIEDVSWEVKHGLNARWRIVGETRDKRRSQQRRAVLKALREAQGEMTTAEIVEAVKRPDGATRKLLHVMEKAGDIVRVRHGVYECATVTS